MKKFTFKTGEEFFEHFKKTYKEGQLVSGSALDWANYEFVWQLRDGKLFVLWDNFSNGPFPYEPAYEGEGDDGGYAGEFGIDDSKKIIILKDGANGNVHLVMSDDDLYLLYNDFAQVNDDDGEYVEEVDEIREWHSLVYDGTISGFYNLYDFEKMAMKLIMGIELDENENPDHFKNKKEEIKMELTKIQKEAIERMEILKLMQRVVEDYKSGIIYFSERIENRSLFMDRFFDGILFVANDELMEKVREIEDRYKISIYHIQKSHTSFGTLYAMLYVSEEEEEEWEQQKSELKDGYAIIYCYNEDCEDFSEFGSAMFKPKNGGITRLS